MYGKTLLVGRVADVCNATFFFLIRQLSSVRLHLGHLIDAQAFPNVQKAGFRALKLLQGGGQCSHFRDFGLEASLGADLLKFGERSLWIMGRVHL
jgi:hypothetical protein